MKIESKNILVFTTPPHHTQLHTPHPFITQYKDEARLAAIRSGAVTPYYLEESNLEKDIRASKEHIVLQQKNLARHQTMLKAFEDTVCIMWLAVEQVMLTTVKGNI